MTEINYILLLPLLRYQKLSCHWQTARRV